MKALKMNPFPVLRNMIQMMKMQSSFGSEIELPAIITGQKTEHFFDDVNDAEQDWIVSVLDNLVKSNKR